MVKFTVSGQRGLSVQPSFQSDFQTDGQGRDITINRCELVEIIKDDLGNNGRWTEVSSNSKRGFILREDLIDWPADCEAVLASQRETSQKSFAEACLIYARVSEVNAPALIAIARAESKTAWEGDAATGKIGSIVDDQSGATGPFQFLPAVWERFIKANPAAGLSASDIQHPRLQCVAAAALARQAWDRVHGKHDRSPTTVELYMAHLFGPKAPLTIGDASGSTRMADVLPKILEGDAGSQEEVDKLIARRADLLKDGAQSKTVDAFKAVCFERLAEGLGIVEGLFQQLNEFQTVPDGPEQPIPGDAEFVTAVLNRVRAMPGLNKPDRLEAARLILEGFNEAGYGKIQQIAALANAVGESRLDRTAHNAVGEDSVGLFQLNRQGGVGQGHEVEELKDAKTNIRLIIQEVKRVDRGSNTKNFFSGASTLQRAVEVFVRFVERPADTSGAIGGRLAIARDLTPRQTPASDGDVLPIGGGSLMAVAGFSIANSGDYEADFVRFFNDIGLTFFKPHEFLKLGSRNSNPSSPAFGLNTLPPRELWPNIVPTARVLDRLRARLGFSVFTTSVYRNERYNAAIGGAVQSQHMAYKAADFRVSGTNTGPQHWAGALRDMRSQGAFKGGIGVYDSFVHVDTRGENTDWVG